MVWGRWREAASRSCSCCECCLVRRVGPRGVTPRMGEMWRVLGSEGVVEVVVARRWLRWQEDKEEVVVLEESRVVSQLLEVVVELEKKQEEDDEQGSDETTEEKERGWLLSRSVMLVVEIGVETQLPLSLTAASYAVLILFQLLSRVVVESGVGVSDFPYDEDSEVVTMERADLGRVRKEVLGLLLLTMLCSVEVGDDGWSRRDLYTFLLTEARGMSSMLFMELT